MAHDTVCIADTSSMLEYQVFKSMHARASKQWLDSLSAATRNATGSLLSSTEDTAMQTRTEGLQTCKCNLFYHLNITAASQHSQMVQPSSSTEVHKFSCIKFRMYHRSVAHHQIRMCDVKYLVTTNSMTKLLCVAHGMPRLKRRNFGCSGRMWVMC